MKFTTSTLLALATLALQVAARAGIANADVPSNNTIAANYIVVLKPTTDASGADKHCDKIRKHHAKRSLTARGHSYVGLKNRFDFKDETHFQGYSIECDESTLDEILESPEVSYVEKDSIASAAVTQSNAEWGLSRISHRTRQASGYQYLYKDSGAAGYGSTIYVLDTGVRTTHQDFEKRAKSGPNFIAGSQTADNHGHGTHVAATAAGKRYGVAKRANIIAVKVLADDGNAPWSVIIQGLEWAAAHAVRSGKRHKAVINMSISGDRSQAMNDAIEAAAKLRVLTVVAAGNEGRSADFNSPASAPNAITVGSIDRWNYMSSFSNYGRFIDIFAPGSGIRSASNLSNTGYRTLDGTSMASPHVAGVAAYFQSMTTYKYTPYQMKQTIQQRATNNQVREPLGSINKIVYNGGGKVF